MEFKFTDIFDIQALSKACEGFTRFSGMVTALLDLEGNVHIATGWQDICTKFHRKNETTAGRCRKSDTILAGKLSEGKKYNVYKCENGLVDVAIPVFVNKEHLANFFTGQFFFQPPDVNFFKDQAKQFGFDEKEYMDALNRVPVFDEEYVVKCTGFLVELAQLIGEMGLEKLKTLQANKKVMQKLEREALILKAAVEQAPIGVALADEQLNLYYCNPAGLGLRGGNRGELVEIPKDALNNWQVLNLNGEPYEVDDLPLVRAIAGGKIIREEFIVRSQNKTDFICDAIACPVYEKGKVVAGIIFFPDITDRKKAEKELAESEKRFLDVIYNSDDAILIIDNETFVDCNKAVVKMLKYNNKKELLMTHPSIHSPPFQPDGRESYEKAEEVIKTAINKGYHRFEWMHKKADGEVFPVEVSLTPVSYKGKTIIHCLWRDITEQKKAEEKIIASELKFRKLFEDSRDSIFIAEAKTGILVDCNTSAQKLIKREKCEIIGKHQSFLHPDEELDGGYSKTYKEHIGEKEGHLLETKIITGKGEIRDVEISSTIIEIDNKLYAQGIFRDITESKKTKKEVKRKTIQIEKAHRHAMYMLAVASENRDTDTGGHIKRIGNMTKKIAKELGMNPVECKKIELDSLLHDIGKIAVPDVILLKQGKLSEKEFELMKEHTIKGAEIIGDDEWFNQSREIALYHHEKWNGKGYPEKLRGEQIPLSAKIVAVADAFDALISHRPYKNPWSTEKAIEQIKKESGSHFDPKVVDAFLKVMSLKK